jgi:hypothetical protein
MNLYITLKVRIRGPKNKSGKGRPFFLWVLNFGRDKAPAHGLGGLGFDKQRRTLVLDSHEHFRMQAKLQ